MLEKFIFILNLLQICHKKGYKAFPVPVELIIFLFLSTNVENYINEFLKV